MSTCIYSNHAFNETIYFSEFAIERFWPEVNIRVNYPSKKALVALDNNQIIDMSYEIQKFCISFVACAAASHGLKIVIMSWNAHTIPGIIYFLKLVSVVTTQYDWIMSNRPINIS